MFIIFIKQFDIINTLLPTLNNLSKRDLLKSENGINSRAGTIENTT